MPMFLMDVTPPTVNKWEYSPKFFFNYQATVEVHDPSYQWNDIELQGIGVDKQTLKVSVPFGFSYGQPEVKPGSCEDCIEYQFNYVKFLPGKIKIHVDDYFGNKSVSVVQSTFYQGFDVSSLNYYSLWYYAIVVIALASLILLSLLVYTTVFKRKKSVTKKAKK
jgi:hypothetical protein